MSEELYQQAIKDLARAAHGNGRLANASASAKLDNPLCGDRIALDSRLDEGRIIAIGHDTRGCLLCRAAASWLASVASGATPEELAAIHEDVRSLLKGVQIAPAIRAGLLPFSPVREHKSRHGCVLLPFEALQQALTKFRTG
jgi:nitrogen fixation NifU-like protein